MRLTTFASLILLTFVAAVSAADYEVIIDERTYLFSQGVKQEILLKEGQRISVSVKDIKTREFQEHGVSFSYPSEMKIEQESTDGLVHITLGSTDSTQLLIQVYTVEISPAELQDDFLSKFREVFAELGASSPANATVPCKRTIGGVEYQGTEFSYALANLAHKIEIYTMKKGEKTLAIIFQYAEEDKEKATLRFDVVTKSFKG